MVEVIQTIALKDDKVFTDYDFFKTENGDYGFFDYQSQKWYLAQTLTNCREFCIYLCPINNPTLSELNDWVGEDGDKIIGFFNGTVKFEGEDND